MTGAPASFRERMARARSVAVLTGAGISAESGVPTFRGADGLWRNYNFMELATPEAFRRDPRLVWEWYDWRRQVVAGCHPNPAHHALAWLEKQVEDFLLITQNVDGLHRRAGSRRLVELHGSLWRVRCVAEGRVAELPEVPLRTLPPRCACGSLLRPDIVWFGEALPADALERAFAAAESCEMMLVVGTSSLVQPAASLPHAAKAQGAYVVEINLDSSPLSRLADECHHGKAGEILPEILGLTSQECGVRNAECGMESSQITGAQSAIRNPQSAIPAPPCQL